MDLRAIETEMSAIGPMEVTSDEFDGTVSSIEEFLKTGALSLKSVQFRSSAFSATRHVSLYVVVDEERAFITGSDDDHEVAGVQARVEQILRARQPKFALACGSAAPWLFLPFITMGAIGTALLSSRDGR